MKLFQLLMLIGITIMVSGGIGIMLAIFTGSKLQQQAEDKTVEVDDKKIQNRFLLIAIAQKISTFLFVVGFLLMSVAASLR